MTSYSAREVCRASGRMRLSSAVVPLVLASEHPTLHEWDLGRLEAKTSSLHIQGYTVDRLRATLRTNNSRVDCAITCLFARVRR